MPDQPALQKPRKRELFGRKRGRHFGIVAQDMLDNLYPQINIKELIDIENCRRLNPKDLFTFDPKKIVCEVGFGDGDMLGVVHKQYPDHGFIGCEPFLNGLVNMLKTIEDTKNIRLWQDDALLLLDIIEDSSIDDIYILNPDPWPKKRHYKRRIVRAETLDIYARIMKSGGTLVMTTDVDDLAEWMVTQAFNHPAFSWTAESQNDWKSPPKNWISTKYERKGIEAGRQQSYLIFKRK